MQDAEGRSHGVGSGLPTKPTQEASPGWGRGIAPDMFRHTRDMGHVHPQLRYRIIKGQET